MRKLSRIALIVGAVLLIAPTLVFGQSTAELCRAFINRAFSDIGSNCADLASNEACYAFGNFGEVTTTFYADGTPQLVRTEIFTEPADRTSLLSQAELETLESVTTEDFLLDRDLDDDNDGIQEADEDDNRWGVVLQEVRANLPRQLEQNTAVYGLFGGARLENGVFPEDALMLNDEPLAVETGGEVTLVSAPPGLGYLVPSQAIDTFEGTLEADGISPDGDWLRVFFRWPRTFGERATAWVSVTDVVDVEGVDDLPIIGPETYTPMQRAFLTNSFNAPLCDELPPPGLLVQGPGEIETDFLVNNVSMRVTSTAFIEQIAPRRMRVTTLNGFTLLNPDTAGEEVIPPGFSRVLCLTDERDLGIDAQVNDREPDANCPEGPPAQGPVRVGAVAGLPGNTLNYEFGSPVEFCGSAIGGVICTIQLPEQAASRVEALCGQGVLPPDVCQVFGF